MFKYCRKCVGMRQFLHSTNNEKKYCDMCGAEA